jgi:hypothetical protein
MLPAHRFHSKQYIEGKQFVPRQAKRKHENIANLLCNSTACRFRDILTATSEPCLSHNLHFILRKTSYYFQGQDEAHESTENLNQKYGWRVTLRAHHKSQYHAGESSCISFQPNQALCLPHQDVATTYYMQKGTTSTIHQQSMEI